MMLKVDRRNLTNLLMLIGSNKFLKKMFEVFNMNQKVNLRSSVNVNCSLLCTNHILTCIES